MTGQPLNGTTVNGATRPPRVRTFEGFMPFQIGGVPAAQPEPTPAPEPEPRFDPVVLAEADRIRTLAEAEAEAVRIRAAEEAEKQRIANERASMRLEKERADHAAHLARRAAEAAKATAEAEKANAAAEEEAARDAARDAEQQRSEFLWKWGARSIYAVGLIIAAPVQFLHFWDPTRPFLIAAPALLEGLALVLAAGAAWAVAHRRDVLPYRVGIMLGALIAAGINMYGGLSDPRIGFNAGLIGAIASLGGPVVLMAYEHGIAQKVDGIPSRRERRAERKRKAAEEAARAKARSERKAAEDKAAADKKARDDAAEAEQQRRDADRQGSHEKVWKVADAMRSARGSATVTEQIWAEAWLRVTGSKVVGVTPEIEAASRVAAEQMKTASETASSLVESHRPPTVTKDPDAPDGRRSNGGTPPIRRPGDSTPPSRIARTQARLERTTNTPREDS